MKKTTSRPYNGMEDFLRIRSFLMNTYRLNQTYHNWAIRRWEPRVLWGTVEQARAFEKLVRIWENEHNDIVGVVHTEGEMGNAWLQVHPDYRHIEEEMVDWAEENIVAPNNEGVLRLWFEVYDYDTMRQEMLAKRGYKQLDDYGYIRWRSMDKPIPEVTIAEGYTIRSLRPGDMSDTSRWADVIKDVFGHDESQPQTIKRWQDTSPSYRHDLHIIAEAENGIFAAFAGLSIDIMNNVAEFEPVGTHPDHRQKGLGKAVMYEGMRRLIPLGVSRVYVGTDEMIAANALYESTGFTDYHMNHIWWKAF